MRPIVAFVLAATVALSGCASLRAAEPDPDLHVLTPEQQASCKAQGGCVTYTMRALERLVREAIAYGAKNGV
jgi:hypothetical protein